MDEALEILHPKVGSWFSKFGELSPPQALSLAPISKGENVLISSPTGSGKTLAAFIYVISELVRLAENNSLEDRVYCVYVSPLRALNNDIRRNLLRPLKEMNEDRIRVGVRTGDTPQSERQRMLRKPPHILITTPESLGIMLSAPKFREKLRGVKWVIVDEIHELCSSKRGVHLSLSLERLVDLSGEFQRIGLSATIHPIEEVAQFLVGLSNGKPRDCTVIKVDYLKKTDIKLICPVEDLINTPSDLVSRRMYETLKGLIEEHRTTLVFTNTRSGTERVVFHLGKEKVEDLAAHHSSLSRETRLEVEEKLKNGELKAVVCSTSLELGIDIGYVDLVVQVGSPKSISRCLQRTGRAGHRLKDISKGRIIALDRDDIVEIAVMIEKAYDGMLDRVQIPRNCLDVLAQHLVGMAIDRVWSIEEAYSLVRRAYPYKDLEKEKFVSVLKYLSGEYDGVDLESNKVYGKIWFNGREFGRRGKYTRVIYSTNIGTIPDEAEVKVYCEGRKIGYIEEEFLERLMPGDRFVLGGRVYEFRRAKGSKAYVKKAYSERPTVPSWFSEMLPLSYDLALEIGKFRERMFQAINSREDPSKVIEEIKEKCRTNLNSAKSIYNYFLEEYLFLNSLGVRDWPSHKKLLIERVREGRKLHLIFHALFGRRVNDALSRALAYLFNRNLGRTVLITVNDNGFMLTVPRIGEEKIKEILSNLNSRNIREVLRKAILNTEMIKRRFRHCATRSLMILRNYRGREKSVYRQQLSAESLLKALKDTKGFPVIEETIREIMEDLMDVKNAEEVLSKLERGEMEYVFSPEFEIPSPFAHNLYLAGASDAILMEDKRKVLEDLHQMVLERISIVEKTS